MKAGLSSSVILHGVLLAMAIVSLSAPGAMQVASVDAMPIDIIPIEELTQIQEGAKDAPKTDKAAPKPTSRPDEVADAQKTGENKQDLKNDPVPDAPEKPIEKTTEPPPEAKPTPTPAPDRFSNPVYSHPSFEHLTLHQGGSLALAQICLFWRHPLPLLEFASIPQSE